MILTREELDLLKPTISSYEWSRAVDTCGDLIDTIEQALQDRDVAIKEREFLSTQNAELLEDIAAIRLEHDALDAKVAELERGEYICKRCGLRKDGEGERGDF